MKKKKHHIEIYSLYSIKRFVLYFSGKRSDYPEDPDWAPTLFSINKDNVDSTQKSACKRERLDRYQGIQAKRLRFTVNSNRQEVEHDASDVSNCAEEELTIDASTQFEAPDDPLLSEVMLLRKEVTSLKYELCDRNLELYRLREENSQLKDTKFGFRLVKKSDNWLHFFTGFLSVSVFMWVVNCVRGKAAICHSHLSAEDHVLVVLMKLRLGLLNKDIAHRFGMQTSTISNIYRSWLPVISSSLQNLIVWPDRANIRKHIPSSFTHKFRDCICTIDCSEIFTEMPSNLTARAQTWSNYKHNNTIKYLIGISPAGAVTFLSAGWGGRVSDKQITMDSGFLDKLSPGDCILADRGFLIAHEVNARGAFLKMPSFTKGKK